MEEPCSSNHAAGIDWLMSSPGSGDVIATDELSRTGRIPLDAGSRGTSEATDLRGAIGHDFSTSDEGVVPALSRRPLWHLTALWTTLAANFSFLFLGVALYSGGYGL